MPTLSTSGLTISISGPSLCAWTVLNYNTILKKIYDSDYYGSFYVYTDDYIKIIWETLLNDNTLWMPLCYIESAAEYRAGDTIKVFSYGDYNNLDFVAFINTGSYASLAFDSNVFSPFLIGALRRLRPPVPQDQSDILNYHNFDYNMVPFVNSESPCILDNMNINGVLSSLKTMYNNSTVDMVTMYNRSLLFALGVFGLHTDDMLPEEDMLNMPAKFANLINKMPSIVLINPFLADPHVLSHIGSSETTLHIRFVSYGLGNYYTNTPTCRINADSFIKTGDSSYSKYPLGHKTMPFATQQRIELTQVTAQLENAPKPHLLNMPRINTAPQNFFDICAISLGNNNIISYIHE